MVQHRDKLLKGAYFLFSLVWLFYVLGQRFAWLFEIDYPPTKDGYFYLQEFKIRMLEGRSYYEIKSVFFGVFSFLGNFLGLHEVQLYNFTYLSGLSFFTVAILLLAGKRENLWILPSLCALFWNSDTLFFSSYNFLEYSFSLCFLLFLFAFYVRSESALTTTQKFLWLLIACIPMSMHYFTASCGLLLLACLMPRPRGFYQAYLYAGLFFILSVIYAMAQKAGKTIFAESWLRPELGWQVYCRLYGCSPFQESEYWLFTAIWIFFALSLFVFKPRSKVTVWLLGIMLFLSLPLWNTKNGLATRLALSCIWFGILLLSSAVHKNRHYRTFAVVVCLFAATFWFTARHSFWGTVGRPTHVFPQYKPFLHKLIPKNSIVFTEHGMQFAVNYYLDIHSTTRRSVTRDYVSQYVLRRVRRGDRERCEYVTLDTSVQPGSRQCYLLSKEWVVYRLK